MLTPSGWPCCRDMTGIQYAYFSKFWDNFIRLLIKKLRTEYKLLWMRVQSKFLVKDVESSRPSFNPTVRELSHLYFPDSLIQIITDSTIISLENVPPESARPSVSGEGLKTYLG